MGNKRRKNTQGQSVMRGPEVPLSLHSPKLFPFRPAYTAGGMAGRIINYIQFIIRCVQRRALSFSKRAAGYVRLNNAHVQLSVIANWHLVF